MSGATRTWLESWRAAGHRLVAGDAERLYDMQTDDDVYCTACGVRFALHCDEERYKTEAKAQHMASDSHKSGDER